MLVHRNCDESHCLAMPHTVNRIIHGCVSLTMLNVVAISRHRVWNHRGRTCEVYSRKVFIVRRWKRSSDSDNWTRNCRFQDKTCILGKWHTNHYCMYTHHMHWPWGALHLRTQNPDKKKWWVSGSPATQIFLISAVCICAWAVGQELRSTTS